MATNSKDVLLPNAVPQCEYMGGCVATAVGMLLAYYDLYGYKGKDFSNIIEGTPELNARGLDGDKYDMDAFDTVLGNFVASQGYYDRFFEKTASEEYPYTWSDLSNYELNISIRDCLADWLGTGQMWLANSDYGSSSFPDYTLSDLLLQTYDYTFAVEGTTQTISVPWNFVDWKYGLASYLDTRGYTLDTDKTANHSIDVFGGSFTFEDYMAEIDAGRPVIVETDGHAMIGYGYNAETREVIFDDDYDHDRRVVWGGTFSYGSYTMSISSITTVVLQTTDSFVGNQTHLTVYNTASVVGATFSNLVDVERYEKISSSSGTRYRYKLGAGGALSNIGVVSVNKTKFIGNTASTGGAVYNHIGDVAITGSEFRNNVVDSYGGALYNLAGTVTITGSTFRNNSGTYGGALYNKEAVVITGSTFNSNKASANGGAIYNTGTNSSTVTTSYFNYNSASSRGGAIYVYNGSLTVKNALFTVNTASIGGAVYNWDTVSVTGSTFRNNRATSGGALYNRMEADLKSLTFTGNTATIGGAIYNSGTMSITGGTFTGNTATTGGAIYNIDVLDAANLTFSGNTATIGGAVYNAYINASTYGVVNLNGTLTLATAGDRFYNCSVLNWDLTGSTCGKLVNYQYLTNTGSHAALTITVSSSQALGSYTIATGTFTSVTNKSTFTVKSATGSGTVNINIGGSAVTYNGNRYVLAVSGGNLVLTISEPSTGYERFVATSSQSVELDGGSVFKNPSSYSGNGAAGEVRSGGFLSAENVTFQSNTATGNGGAIYNIGNVWLGDGVVFSGNKAASGGAIYNAYTNASTCGDITIAGTVTLATSADTLYNCSNLYWDLTSALYGNYGRLVNYQYLVNSGSHAQMTIIVGDESVSGSYTIATGSFSSLSGKNTFLISDVSGSDTESITVNGDSVTYHDLTYTLATSGSNLVLFVEQPAAYERFFVSDGETFTLLPGKTYTNTEDCYGYSGGAGEVESGGVLTGTGVAFSGNTSTSDGGAVYNMGTVTFGNSRFSGNLSENNGGAICNEYDSVADIENSVFSGNTAACYGGALCNNSGEVNIGESTFSHNCSGDSGGALYTFGTILVKNTVLSGNTAANSGGAIYNEGVLTLSGVTFNANHSDSGGALYNGYNYDDFSGIINLTGSVTLATSSDTIYNAGILNWVLTGGTASYGQLVNYQYLINDDSDVHLTVTVNTDQQTGKYTIATGSFLSVTDKDSFTLIGTDDTDTVITIDGDAVTYGGRKYALNVSGSNLVLTVSVISTYDRFSVASGESLTLVSGTTYTNPDVYSGNGGAGNVQVGGSLTATNVLFYGNTATGYGGALFNVGSVTLSGVTFSHNKSGFGGAVVNGTANSGAICGTITLKGAVTLATSDDVLRNDAILNWNLTGGTASYGKLINYQYLTNSGTYSKLTITVKASQTIGSYTIATGTFTSTTLKNTFSITGVSGATDVTITIGGSTVTYGGRNYALAVSGSNLVLTVSKLATFERFTVYSGSTLTLISGKTYTNPEAYSGFGGVVEVNSGGILKGSNVTMSGNTAIYGGAIDNWGSANISASRFIGNTATRYGGAVFNGKSASISGTLFKDNYAMTGGAIESDNAILLTGSTFTGNYASSCGAALFDGGYATVTNCAFSSNIATDDGGAIYVSLCVGVTNSTFTENFALDDGGVIYNGGVALITGSTFSGNGAYYYGGVLANYGSTATLLCTNSLFTDNIAAYRGGAIHNYGYLGVSGSTFSGNRSSIGGAIYHWIGSMVVDTSLLTGNTASKGGAIYNYDAMSITGSTFTSNSATTGGAIYNIDALDAANLTFSGNTATYGGAIYNAYSTSGTITYAGTVNLTGAVTLATANDTFYNCSVLNWDLTGSTCGKLVNYQYLTNSGSHAALTITVSSSQTVGTYVIATGTFTSLSGKNTFSITGVSGVNDISISIGGAVVAYNDLDYKLAVSGSNLVLTIAKPVVYSRFIATASSPVTLATGKTYTNPSVYSGNGGAGEVKAGGTLTANKVMLYGNTANGKGGAIYNAGAISLSGITFSANRAAYGGAIYNAYVNAATCGTVTMTGALTLTTANDTLYNCSVVNWDLTRGSSSAGKLVNYQYLTNSGNYAKLTLTVTAAQTVGTYTIASGSFTDVKGKDTFSITGVSGANNVSVTIGGDTVIYSGRTYALTVSGSNLVLTVGTPAPYTRFSVTSGSTFTPTAGNVYTNPDVYSSNGGAGEVKSGGTLCATSVSLRGNTSKLNGGAVFNSGKMDVKGATFSGNQATNYGGAIENRGSITSYESLFSDNCANYGGAIDINRSRSASFYEDTFSGNIATSYGGAIENKGKLAMEKVVAFGNSSKEGGMMENQGTATVKGSTFYENTATANGGVIANYAGLITVSDCVFSGNTAATSGGAIYNIANMSIDNVTFDGNTAGVNGGAIVNSGTMSLHNVQFKTVDDTILSSGRLFLSGTISITGNFSASGSVVAEDADIVLNLQAYSAPNTAAIISDLSKIDGSANWTLTVGEDQKEGSYLIAGGASDYFYDTVTLQLDNGYVLGSLDITTPLKYFGMNYTLRCDDSVLTLDLSQDAPVYVNSAWAGFSSGKVVSVTGGGTAVIGQDAFATEAAAVAAVGTQTHLIMLGTQSSNMTFSGRNMGVEDMVIGGTVYAGNGSNSVKDKQVALKNTSAKRFLAGGNITGYKQNSTDTPSRVLAEVTGGSFGGIFGGGDMFNATVCMDTALTVTGATSGLIFGGANIKVGTEKNKNYVSLNGDTDITLSGVTSTQYAIGGSLIGSYASESRTGNISLKIDGGTFAQVYGGSLIQSMVNVSSGIAGDIDVSVGGGAQITNLYGGSGALKVSGSKNMIVTGSVSVTLDVTDGTKVSKMLCVGGVAKAQVAYDSMLTIVGSGSGSDFLGTQKIIGDTSYAKGDTKYVEGERTLKFENFNGTVTSALLFFDTITVDAKSQVSFVYAFSHFAGKDWNVSADNAANVSVYLPTNNNTYTYSLDFAGSTLNFDCELDDDDEWTVFKIANDEDGTAFVGLTDAIINLNGEELAQMDDNLFVGENYQLEYRTKRNGLVTYGMLVASRLQEEDAHSDSLALAKLA